MEIVRRAILPALFVVAIFAGRLPTLAFVALLAAITAGEIYRSSRTRGDRPIAVIGLIGIAVLLFVAHARGDRAPTLFPAVIAGAFGVTAIAMMVRAGERPIVRALTFTMLPIVSVGLLLSYVLIVRSSRDGTALALFLGSSTVLAEVGAWLASRSSGSDRTLLWRRLGGAIGAASLAAVFITIVRPETIPTVAALVVAAAVAVATLTGEQVGAMIEGDLFRSKPGIRATEARALRHIDGALLGAPVFFYLVRVLAR